MGGGSKRQSQGSWGRALALLTLCTRHQDGSGYIDENELDALLKDLYEKNKKVSGARAWGDGSS